MKVIVIADTHIPERAKQIPKSFLEKIKDADLIVHAGDFVEIAVLEELKKLAPVTAVWGNMDSADIRKQLKAKEIIKIEGLTLGLMHGRGHPNNLINLLKEEFKNDAVDIIVFGHSHKPVNTKIGKTLFFNPGSLTDIFFSDFASYGIIKIEKSEYKATIERL